MLDLDVVRRGRPLVVAGADRLDAPVRWVHAVELTDVARLLRGGELVLSTGIALPDDDRLLAAYVDRAGRGRRGRAGRRAGPPVRRRRCRPRWSPRPRHGRAAADRVRREVAFIEITEAVHARIIDAQLDELRVSERLHEMFTELSVAGASPEEIVRQAAALAGRPVILADLSHRVLACSPGGADPGRLLSGFARAEPLGSSVRPDRLRRGVGLAGHPGRRAGRGLGAGDPGLRRRRPPARIPCCIERAATTLALGRLLTRHRESLERQAHRTLISGIISQAHADPAEAAVRSRALGVPVDGRQLIAMVLRFRDRVVSGPGSPLGVSAHARVLDLADTAAAACRAERIPSLVGTLDDDRAGAMLSLGPRVEPDDVLTRLATRIRDRAGVDPDLLVIGVGATAGSIRDVRRSFLEASQVADVAAPVPADPARRCSTGSRPAPARPAAPAARRPAAADVRRARTRRAAGHATPALIDALAAYLAAGGNKAEAAKAAHLARPTFYERLRRIERILGTDLSSAESRTSLHVALLALDAAQADR